MTTVLVTGCNGFVGTHLINELKNSTEKIKIIGCDISQSPSTGLDIEYYQCNISNKSEVESLLLNARADCVYHLAAVSNTSVAEQEPFLTYNTNFMGTLNLLHCAASQDRIIKILIIGSSECYGIVDQSGPINENYPCRPITHYGLSKLFSEKIAKKYNHDYKNLSVIITRSFNHSGPGQAMGFVIPDFARQFAEISLGIRTPVVEVGNIDIIRDFLDVRDVVNAYITLMSKGESGEVYNICSGKGVSLKYILEYYKKYSGVNDLKVKTTGKKKRKIDNPIVVGNNEKLKKLSWNTRYSIEDTLKDVFEYWKERATQDWR